MTEEPKPWATKGEFVKSLITMAILTFALGCFLGTKLEHHLYTHNISFIKKQAHFSIDGEELPNIEACWNGCRSEDDIVCEKFRALLRSK